MKPEMNNALFRMNAIICLLSSDQYSYTAAELAEALQVPPGVILEDLTTLMENRDRLFPLFTEAETDVASETVQDLLDQFEDAWLDCPTGSITEENFLTYMEKIRMELSLIPISEEGLQMVREFLSVLSERTRSNQTFRKTVYDFLKKIRLSAAKSDSFYMESDRITISLSGMEKNILDEFLQENRTNDFLVKNQAADFTEGEEDMLRRFEEAIRRERAVKIDYVTAKGDVRFKTIEPLAVVHSVSDHLVYVITLEEGRLTPYRLDRIRHAELTRHAVPRLPEHEEILERLGQMWGMENREPVHVKVRIYNEAGVVSRVMLELGERAKEHFNEQEDGTWLYEDDVIGINKFISWLHSLGSSAVVLEPADVRERIKSSAEIRRSYYV